MRVNPGVFFAGGTLKFEESGVIYSTLIYLLSISPIIDVQNISKSGGVNILDFKQCDLQNFWVLMHSISVLLFSHVCFLLIGLAIIVFTVVYMY